MTRHVSERSKLCPLQIGNPIQFATIIFCVVKNVKENCELCRRFQGDYINNPTISKVHLTMLIRLDSIAHHDIRNQLPKLFSF